MYLYEIISDLELHKQGINIDKFVIHRSMRGATDEAKQNALSPIYYYP